VQSAGDYGSHKPIRSHEYLWLNATRRETQMKMQLEIAKELNGMQQAKKFSTFSIRNHVSWVSHLESYFNMLEYFYKSKTIFTLRMRLYKSLSIAAKRSKFVNILFLMGKSLLFQCLQFFQVNSTIGNINNKFFFVAFSAI